GCGHRQVAEPRWTPSPPIVLAHGNQCRRVATITSDVEDALSIHKNRRLSPHAVDAFADWDLHKIPLREIVTMADRHGRRKGPIVGIRPGRDTRHYPVAVLHLHRLIHWPESITDHHAVLDPFARF